MCFLFPCISLSFFCLPVPFSLSCLICCSFCIFFVYNLPVFFLSFSHRHFQFSHIWLFTCLSFCLLLHLFYFIHCHLCTVCLSFCLSTCLLICLSQLPSCLYFCLPVCYYTYLVLSTVFFFFFACVYLSICLPVNLFVLCYLYISLYLSVCLPVYIYINLTLSTVFFFICLPVFLPVFIYSSCHLYISVYLSVCLSTSLNVPSQLSLHVSICLCLSVLTCSFYLLLFLPVYLPVNSTHLTSTVISTLDSFCFPSPSLLSKPGLMLP